jgi:hypothetical protein
MGGRSIIYLMAFMDAARFINGWEMLVDKKTETTARVL